MYQFDFVLDAERPETISVMANTYTEAIEKIKAIGVPKLNIKDWVLEGIYEHNVIKLLDE